MEGIEVLKELNLPEDIFYANQSEPDSLFEEELPQNPLETSVVARNIPLLLLLNSYQKKI